MKNIFKESILSTNIQIRPNEYDKNIDKTILEKLKKKVEGKCDKNGYIKPESAEIIERSIGTMLQSQFNGYSSFKVWYRVLCCNPVEGMIVKCSVLNRNKMGIFCELYDCNPSPLTIILAKQHHLNETKYEEVKVGSSIDVEIVGIKFEYNDTQISCIGRIHNKNNNGDMETNEEEEYYQEEEDDDDMELEQEVIIPEEAPKPVSKPVTLIDLMTPSESPKEEDDVGSGEPESMGTQINDELDLDLELDVENVDISNSDESDLGEDFKGVAMNLEEESAKNRVTIYLKEEDENISKLTGKVYQNLVKEPQGNCFKIPAQPKDKKIKRHFIRYYNYVLLNNMLVDYYEQNNNNPTTIYVNVNYQFKDDMKELITSYLSNMKLEDTEELTHVE